MTDELRTLDEEPGRFAFFAWKNITIMVWVALPDAAAIARLVRVGETRTQEHAGGLSDVHLVAGHIGLPDSDTRAALAEGSQKALPYLAAVAVVLGGRGFWASAMRGFVTGLHVLLQGSFDLRLFAQLEDAAGWLPAVHGERTGVQIASDDLQALLREAQRRARQPVALRAS